MEWKDHLIKDSMAWDSFLAYLARRRDQAARAAMEAQEWDSLLPHKVRYEVFEEIRRELEAHRRARGDEILIEQGRFDA